MAKSSKRSRGKTSTIHDQKLERGDGGELHQIATDDVPVLTTAQGGPVSDVQNSLKSGARGPTVLEDFHFREKIFHFDHARIPERVVHARLRRTRLLRELHIAVKIYQSGPIPTCR